MVSKQAHLLDAEFDDARICSPHLSHGPSRSLWNQIIQDFQGEEEEEDEEEEVMKDGIWYNTCLGSPFIIKATDGQMKANARLATHFSVRV